LKPFQHVNANTTDEAASLLLKSRGKALLIAGGTDLLGILTDDIFPSYPRALINLKTVPGLDSINEDSKGLTIGALAKLADTATHPAVKEKYPLVSQAAKSVAMPQVRNMATIGGNLCQDNRCWYYRYPNHLGGRLICLRKGSATCYTQTRDNRLDSIFGGPEGCFAVCPSDMATALVAMGATATTTKRAVALQDFFTPTPGTILDADEILTEIQVPRPREGSRGVYLKFRLRKSIDFSMVNIACMLTVEGGLCREASIVLGAVAPTPWRAKGAEDVLRGRLVDDAAAEEAGQMALSNAIPLSMNKYKVAIARNLVKRAILASV
jgi:xanthine dehydrogenase YagS FAD-binding subunit